MTSLFRKAAFLICAAALLLFAGCGKDTPEALPTIPYEVITLPTAPPEEAAPEAVDPKEAIEELAVVMEAALFVLDKHAM